MPKATPGDAPDSKKHFDIARPGKTTPSASARPIIVSHGPMMADPMVKKPSAPEVEASSAPTLTTPAKKVIISPGKDSQLTTKKQTTSKKTSSADSDNAQPITVTMNSNRTVAELAAEAEALSSNSETISEEVSKEAPGINLGNEAATSTEKPAPQITEETPEPEKTVPAPDTTENTPDETAASQEDVMGVVSEQAIAKKDDAKKAQARAEFEEKIDKLIKAETYFVPIGAQTRKRHARTFFSVIFLLLLLAAIGVNFALDAGMLTLDGISPLTDVISN